LAHALVLINPTDLSLLADRDCWEETLL